jgi:hypothetical protein
VINALCRSLRSTRSLDISGVHSSIQSDARFQLIIDPSEDQSIMRHLFKFRLLARNSTKMIVCSDLPGDIQGAVSNSCHGTCNTPEFDWAPSFANSENFKGG